jgi:hypothetical protein
VCAGRPAEVVCTLDEYLAKHRRRMAARPRFAYDVYGKAPLTPAQRRELLDALADGDAYIVGGRSAELAGRGGTPRTAMTAR